MLREHPIVIPADGITTLSDRLVAQHLVRSLAGAGSLAPAGRCF